MNGIYIRFHDVLLMISITLSDVCALQPKGCYHVRKSVKFIFSVQLIQ